MASYLAQGVTYLCTEALCEKKIVGPSVHYCSNASVSTDLSSLPCKTGAD